MRALTVEELGVVSGGFSGLVSVGDIDGNFGLNFVSSDIFGNSSSRFGFSTTDALAEEPEWVRKAREFFERLKRMHEEAKRKELERMRIEAQMQRESCPVGTVPFVAGSFGGMASVNGNTVILGPGGSTCLPTGN
jgi:hypothetical protein